MPIFPNTFRRNDLVLLCDTHHPDGGRIDPERFADDKLKICQAIHRVHFWSVAEPACGELDAELVLNSRVGRERIENPSDRGARGFVTSEKERWDLCMGKLFSEVKRGYFCPRAKISWLFKRLLSGKSLAMLARTSTLRISLLVESLRTASPLTKLARTSVFIFVTRSRPKRSMVARASLMTRCRALGYTTR
jgi:hypothetical protein